jgi:hypothetical protein
MESGYWASFWPASHCSPGRPLAHGLWPIERGGLPRAAAHGWLGLGMPSLARVAV